MPFSSKEASAAIGSTQAHINDLLSEFPCDHGSVPVANLVLDNGLTFGITLECKKCPETLRNATRALARYLVGAEKEITAVGIRLDPNVRTIAGLA